MEVETKIMSVLDLMIIISSVITIIVGVLGIIAFFMKIKWKVLLPRFRLKVKLKKYKKIRFNEEKEREKAKEIVSLLFKARKRFEDKDFVYDVNSKRHGNISVKGLYKFHLTPPSESQTQKFKITKISNPNEAYYSEGYPEAQRINNNINVLDGLIRII